MGRAQLEFIPEDDGVFVAAAKRTKLRVRKRSAFYVHGDGRPGAIADILKKLADAHISLGAMHAVCGLNKMFDRTLSPVFTGVLRLLGVHGK